MEVKIRKILNAFSSDIQIALGKYRKNQIAMNCGSLLCKRFGHLYYDICGKIFPTYSGRDLRDGRLCHMGKFLMYIADAWEVKLDGGWNMWSFGKGNNNNNRFFSVTKIKLA